MSEVLLVHGSCHGAWCWDALIPALARHGIAARAIDLPSHGADATPPEAVTLDSYADAILAALDGPTVLLGHSAGGFAITAAAERAPEKVAALIYVCAYVPMPGKSLADMRRMAPSQPLMEAVRVAPDRISFTVDPALAPDKFYHDVPPELAACGRGGTAQVVILYGDWGRNPSGRRKPRCPGRPAPTPCRATTSAARKTAPSLPRFSAP